MLSHPRAAVRYLVLDLARHSIKPGTAGLWPLMRRSQLAKARLRSNPLLSLVLVLGFPVSADAQTIGATVGRGSLDDDIEGADKPYQLGFSWDVYRFHGPLSLTFDALYSDGEGWGRTAVSTNIPLIPVHVHLRVLEAGLGVRSRWQLGRFQPQIAGGVEWMRARAAGERQGEERFMGTDSGVAPWASLGASWRLTQRFGIGANLRFSNASLRFPWSTSGVFHATTREVHLGALLTWDLAGTSGTDPSRPSPDPQVGGLLRAMGLRYGGQQLSSGEAGRFGRGHGVVDELQRQVGLSTDLGRVDWPVRLAVDLVRWDGTAVLKTSGTTGISPGRADPNADVSITEIDVGFRKVWKTGRIWPFVGIGAAALVAEARSESGTPRALEFESRDTDFLPWLSAGATVHLVRGVSLGAEVKYLQGELEFEQKTHSRRFEGEIAAPSLALLVGWQKDAWLEQRQKAARPDQDLAVHAYEVVSAVHVTAGTRFMGESALPIHGESQLGIAMDFRKPSWPIAVAVDLLHSVGREIGHERVGIGSTRFLFDMTQQCTEAGFGVRWARKRGRFRPFAGGGIGVLSMSARAVNVSEFSAPNRPVQIDGTDLSATLWGDGGAYWRIGRGFDVGFEVRTMKTETTYKYIGFEHGEEFQTTSVGLLAGWTWRDSGGAR
jgi:hypothetical protein